MTTKESMTIDERYKYLRLMQDRYWTADKTGRSRLLDEMSRVTELHRKSLIRLLRGDLKRKRRRKQRGRTYGPEVDDAIRVISKSMDNICAERLKPNLVWLARHLEAHRELVVTKRLETDLEKVSVSTIRRIQQRITQDQPRLKRRKAVAYRSYQPIPTRRLAWNLTEPGYFEVDLVHHCGDNAAGHYVCTLQMIDVATGWSERVAVLGRSYLVMQDAFRRIMERLPFPVRELHPDNGSEFLNDHMVRFWSEAMPGLELSRSRPYQKNDNRFVEQKNASLVRDYLGNERFDTVAQTKKLNSFYDGMWVYYNLFQPVMRLSEKEVLPTNNGIHRLKRRHDSARSPLDRLLETRILAPSISGRLQLLRRNTNPLTLLNTLYEERNALFDLPPALASQSQDVRQTLKTKP